MRKENVKFLDDKTGEYLQYFRNSKILLNCTQKVLITQEKLISFTLKLRMPGHEIYH